MTAFNQSSTTLCGADDSKQDFGSSCISIRYDLCQMVDGGNQFCLESSSSSSRSDLSVPGLYFGPSVISAIGDGFYRDPASHVCTPWPLTLPLDMNGGPLFLSPIMQQIFKHLSANILTPSLTSYVLDSSINVKYSIIDGTPSIDVGSGALAGFLASNLVYCCQSLCDSYPTSLGASFGYASIAEAIFAMVAISIYMLLFRQEGMRLSETFNTIISYSWTEGGEGDATDGGRLKTAPSDATRPLMHINPA